MTMPWRRVLAAALALTAAVGGLLVAGPAQATEVTTGTFSFRGDPGDSISAGKSYAYAVSRGDALDFTIENGGMVRIAVIGYNGDQWSLELWAPGVPTPSAAARSASLAPGTYTDAHRYGSNAGGPVLDLEGNGRGCNQVTGSFTVKAAVPYPSGYLQALDVTFEQHCEGQAPAARGEVIISNPTMPPQPPTPTHNPAGPGAMHTGGTGAALANGGDASTPATPADLSTASRVEFAIVGAVAAWIVISMGGLIAVGVLMAVRSRRMRRTMSQPLADE